MTKVMIIGAGGVFGSRLVEQLAQTRNDIHLILARRNRANVSAALAHLARQNISADYVSFDRTKPDVALLRSLKLDVMIDAAGPFQESDYATPKAAIAAKVNYFDLSDARGFCAGFSHLDAAAKQAGVVLITGASSTPALSHAALDHMIVGWRAVHSLLVVIVPGNQAPRGLSVTKAILSCVGKPTSVFQNGKFCLQRGWSNNESISIDGLGERQAALCETPDLDELVRRFHPFVSAEFKAGLELGVMHKALRLLSLLHAPKLLLRYAKAFNFLADVLSPFGTDNGGMLVKAEGLDAMGNAVITSWSLVAHLGSGPNVPVLPILCLLEKLGALPKGAYSAAGHVSYMDIEKHLKRLDMKIAFQNSGSEYRPLFRQALGADWYTLPATTRTIHTTSPAIILEGRADVHGPTNVFGRMIAAAFRFPKAGKDLPLSTIIQDMGNGENWLRCFPQRVMRSFMCMPDSESKSVEERFGMFRFTLGLVASAEGIDMLPHSLRLLGLPMPRFLMPQIKATERVGPKGEHLFDVEIALPLVGRLVHYRGRLVPQRPRR